MTLFLMKKKNKLTLFLFGAALFLNTLFADPVHVGTSLPYPIGNPEDGGISASEFCEFLNAKDCQETFVSCISKYYNPEFKSCIEQHQLWNKPSFSHFKFIGNYHFEYNVIPGHENDIIDAVSNSSAQKEFNVWESPREQKRKEDKVAADKVEAERIAKEEAWAAEAKEELDKNPTRAELRDAINDELAALVDSSYLQKAQEIEQRYPDTAVSHMLPSYFFFDTSDDVIYNKMVGIAVCSYEPTNYYSIQNGYFIPFDDRALWDQVQDFINANKKEIVKDPHVMMDDHQALYRTVSDRSVSNEDLNKFLACWGLKISEEKDSSLGLPKRMSRHVVLADQNSSEDRERWTMMIPLVESLKTINFGDPSDIFTVSMPVDYYIIRVTDTEKREYWKPKRSVLKIDRIDAGQGARRIADTIFTHYLDYSTCSY